MVTLGVTLLPVNLTNDLTYQPVERVSTIPIVENGRCVAANDIKVRNRKEQDKRETAACEMKLL